MEHTVLIIMIFIWILHEMNGIFTSLIMTDLATTTNNPDQKNGMPSGSIRADNDLIMPRSAMDYGNQQLELQNGRLDESDLRRSYMRIIDMVLGTDDFHDIYVVDLQCYILRRVLEKGMHVFILYKVVILYNIIYSMLLTNLLAKSKSFKKVLSLRGFYRGVHVL